MVHDCGFDLPVMDLNRGRRVNQPALFPGGDLLSEGRG